MRPVCSPSDRIVFILPIFRFNFRFVVALRIFVCCTCLLKHEQRDQHSTLVSMANKKDERMVRFMLDAIAAKDPFANTVLAVSITVLFVCSYSCNAG